MRAGRNATVVPTDAAVVQAMDVLLESPFWPKSLSPDVSYARVQDDSDGQRGDDQQLSVLVGHDSDVYVLLPGMTALRFREPLGGGMSPRVRNALIVLAEAIRRDNDVDRQRGIGSAFGASSSGGVAGS
jgi:hypothetical protein